MTPITLFSNTSVEGMYKALRELVAAHPEYTHFDNGRWRIIEIPPQQFPEVHEQSVFILMEYYDIDVWTEVARWLVVASDGEHPNGYASLDEAMRALQDRQGFPLFTLIVTLLQFALDALEMTEADRPDTFMLDLNEGVCSIVIGTSVVCLWNDNQDGNWKVYQVGQPVQIADEEHYYADCCGVIIALDGERVTVEMAFITDTIVVTVSQLRPYEPEDWSRIERNSS